MPFHPRRQRFWHDVQTVHALDTGAVIHFQRVVIVQRQSIGRTGNEVIDVVHVGHVRLHGFLVDLVVFPRTNHCEVGTFDRVHNRSGSPKS